MHLLGDFGLFGAILNPSNILQPGNEYIFTFEHGRLFEYRSDTWVMTNLRERMVNYGSVVTVNRPLFSDRYLITVIPSVAVTMNDWFEAFDASFKDMGYGSASFILAETGRVSTEPGGLRQVVPIIGETVAQAVKPIIPQIAPWMILFGLGVVALYFGFRKMRPI